MPEVSGVPPNNETMVTNEDHEEAANKVSTSYTIFLIVMTIVFLAIAIVFGVNTYFYDKIRKNGCSSNISSSEAEALYWTNLILAVISGIMFIVCIILMFTTTKAPTIATTYLHDLPGTLQAKAKEWQEYGPGARKYFESVYGSAKNVASGVGAAGRKYSRAAGMAAGRGLEGLYEGAQSGWRSGLNE